MTATTSSDDARLHDADAPTAPAARQPWGVSLSRRRIAEVLIAVILGMLLSALDQTVVGTAMPQIVRHLNGLEHYAWVATAYLLASTASMPIWGKLSDAYGRKRFFIVGMVIFVAGSALCGQSHSMAELIAFRAFQGLGAGAMLPISQAILGDIFPPAQRARWAGVLMSVFAVATIIGPLLGGWITDNYSWRWVFYVNLPVGVVALAFAAYALPGHTTMHKHRIDYTGATLLVAAAVPLLLGISWGGSTYPWSSAEVIGCFVVSAVMTPAFIWWELRAAEPVINPRLFENGIFSVSATASAIQSAAMFGAIMFLPLFVQGVQGKSATNSGIILMPMMLGAIVTSIVGGQILARTGRYKALVIGGFVAVIAGAFLLSRMGPQTSAFTLGVNMVVMGLGLGIAMSSFTVIVQNQYPTSRLGEVSAGLQFFRSIGGTIGLAVFGTILNNQFLSNMKRSLPSALKPLTHGPQALPIDNPQVLLAPDVQAKLHAGLDKLFGSAAGERLYTAFLTVTRDSLASAIAWLFVIATIVGAVGLVVVLFLKEAPLRRTHDLADVAESLPRLDDAEAASEAGGAPGAAR